MTILFDTNIIIDIALTRLPFFQDSSKIFARIDGNQIKGCITASSLTDIYYIIKKNSDYKKAISFIESLIMTIDVLNVNRDTIMLALHSNFSDFEDAVQSSAAELNHVDLILSRNVKDFTKSKIPTLTPTEFLEKYKQ
ncbi:PIN domain-containing protein [Pedobacter psychrotolerans]|uniref:PIN domain-containing protein n=1 Tax=Pedobacter psychrotolerans TaxID=1843235 RepID=A0A4V2RZZ0_9SPHI|nr:PIN domain-containing protein [Pedobacter psychrotolerans]TCO28920.1 PIN domain-containing protein [Pedobacter psychrotolerans]GGE52836.1 PIN domain-containing protein [Pedobacter psychrotolerans]